MNLQMLVTNLDLDDMKKLQNNFTTVKQSKRLLELGLPEWTADCCFSKSKDSEYICEGVKHIIPDNFCVQSVPFPAYPCWSVGRLIEIHLKCCTTLNQNDAHIVISRFGIETGGLLQNMYDMVSECALRGKYDFSKLAE